MKLSLMKRLPGAAVAVLLATPGFAAAATVTFTADTLISFHDTTFDGADLVVSNCVLTVDGVHSLASVQLVDGAKLTHTFAPGGFLLDSFSVTNEPHVLAGTNPVSLSASNVFPPSLVLSNSSGTLAYTEGVDYIVTSDTNLITWIARTNGSSIPDGATVLASYSVNNPPIPTGLTLVVSNDFTANIGTVVDVLGTGYLGGPGAGFQSLGIVPDGSGGGHGGMGGNSSSNAFGGQSYDSTIQPIDKGSAGGMGVGGIGGIGGGAVKLVIGGTLQLDGAIIADGANGTNSRSGGGSGGSIWLSAQTISGSGTLSAKGGAGEPIHGGGGGGGRIALYFATNLFTGTISAQGGNGFVPGGAGTVYTRDLAHAAGTVLVDNAGKAGSNTLPQAEEPFDLTVRNGGRIFVSDSGAIGNLTIVSNGGMQFSFWSLTVNGDALIDASSAVIEDGAGFPMEQGTGAGGHQTFQSGGVVTVYGSGAGYGGFGGSAGVTPSSQGGSIGNPQLPPAGGSGNGSSTQPIGSAAGGGGYASSGVRGGSGGGAVLMNVGGTLTLNGRISANGMDGIGTGAGGGAGGSIWLTLGGFAGSGSISANGGQGIVPGGGGGGGRIAIYFNSNSFTGPISAHGGGGGIAGGAGTIFTKNNSSPNGDLAFDNGGAAVTNSAASDFGLFAAQSFGNITVANGANPNFSSQVTSMANLLITSNAWLRVSNVLIQITVTNNATIQAGGQIFGDSLAFFGPGAGGFTASGGGGHGGYGGAGNLLAGSIPAGGNFYDSITAPSQSGSSAGNTSGSAPGGGIIKLIVTGSLNLDGALSVRGGAGAATNGGGGSGGSIWLTLGTLAGSGTISANGGNGAQFGGGGAGGRISISMSSNLFGGSWTAFGGSGFNAGGAGTIFISDAGAQRAQVIVDNGGHPGTNTWWSSLPGNIDLVIRNGAGVIPPFGTVIPALHSLVIGSGSTLGSSNHTFIAATINVQAGGKVTADRLGPGSGTGIGAGATTSQGPAGGAGYGGFGGGNNVPFTGTAYGQVNPAVQPLRTGSGGGGGNNGRSPGGSGGGFVALVATTLIVDGRISCDGGAGAGTNAGGGSGGSIALTVTNIEGSGVISANGGSGGVFFPNPAGSGGGGAGGRVAVLCGSNNFTGTITAYGGAGGANGGAGTIFIQSTTQPNGIVILDNNGRTGTNTPVLNANPLIYPSGADLLVRNGAVAHTITSRESIGNLDIGPGGILTSRPGPTNLECIISGNLLLESGGSILVDGKGFTQGTGPGAGNTSGGFGSGAGYGGNGGASGSIGGGASYGSQFYPVDLGSGGGSGSGPVYSASQGGGAIRLTVAGSATLNGTVSANGFDAIQDNAGGGSGGSIWIAAAALSGNGFLAADGGDGDLYEGGGGAGGRIALYSHTNSFSGAIEVLGGAGFADGTTGTIYLSTNTDLAVIAQTPTGVVTNPVSSVIITFNNAVDPTSFPASEVSLTPPNGAPAPAITLTELTPSQFQITFPAQTAVGTYTLGVGPNLFDVLQGQMSEVYTGAFGVLLPIIQGTITDTNGAPLAGVTLKPGGGLSSAMTDINGNYILGTTGGITFSVTPTNGGWFFVPGFRSYTNVTSSISNQNYIAVSSLSPTLGSSAQSTNLVLRWYGIPGVTYHPLWSTNLIDWFPYGGTLTGSNNTLQLSAPTTLDPMKFFRVQANN
jgi:hypothetical protein